MIASAGLISPVMRFFIPGPVSITSSGFGSRPAATTASDRVAGFSRELHLEHGPEDYEKSATELQIPISRRR
jgi:hypothetical protein